MKKIVLKLLDNKQAICEEQDKTTLHSNVKLSLYRFGAMMKVNSKIILKSVI